MFRNALIINILCIFSFALNAQKTAVDTLKLASNIKPALADSSKVVSDSMSNVVKKLGNIFHTKIDANGIFTTGNVSRFLVQINTNFDVEIHEKLKLTISPAFIYGTQNSNLAEREYFSDARFSYMYREQFYYLAFGNFEKSNLRQINYRWIGAAGIGFKLIDREKEYLSITNVLLYENTDFISDALKDRDLWRNSTRIAGEYHFDNRKMILKHSVFLQPAITENNFRWNGLISLSYKISKSMGFKTTLESSYESLVVLGRQNTDTRWTFGIEWERKK